MRTASLRDEDRLIIVRRLDLGGISARASATEWSSRLEGKFRDARPIAVRFDEPAAASAESVFFPDRHEPWLILAERTATSRPCAEWYWRAALPGWRAELPPDETLRLCFATLAAAGGLPLTVRLGIRLHARGGLTTLLRSLRPGDVARIGPPFQFAEADEVMAEIPPDDIPAGLVSVLSADETALVADWGGDDRRCRWLAAVHLVRIGGTAAALAPQAVATELAIRVLVRAWIGASAPGRALLDGRHQPSPAPPGKTPPAPPAPTLRPPVVGETSDRGNRTQLGGLFFAVPLLVRAGLPPFIAHLARAEAPFYGWHVLHGIGRHARARPDDPLMQLMADLPAPAPPVARWLLAANRLALRLSGLRLRPLVRRPARVSVNPTHISVWFQPGDADVRVRCAGLDLDPGWVRWLGRVITYYYDGDD